MGQSRRAAYQQRNGQYAGHVLEQVKSDIGYGSVTHEGAGLLTIHGGVSMAGRTELVEWVDLSMEGERTMQGDGAAHQIASTATWVGSPTIPRQ